MCRRKKLVVIARMVHTLYRPDGHGGTTQTACKEERIRTTASRNGKRTMTLMRGLGREVMWE